MSTRPSEHPPGAPPAPSRRNTAVLLWSVALLAGAGTVWLVLLFTGLADAGGSLIAVAWIMLVMSFAVSAWTRTRQRRLYWQEFPSLEAVRRKVDTEPLRTLRDRDGQAAAVRLLRRDVPGIPISDAKRLIKTL